MLLTTSPTLHENDALAKRYKSATSVERRTARVDRTEKMKCPSCGKSLVVSIHRTAVAGSYGAADVLARSIAEERGIPWSTVVGRSRRRHVVDVRSGIAVALRERTILSLADIGQVLGGRDHTTVMNLLRRAERTTGQPLR